MRAYSVFTQPCGHCREQHSDEAIEIANKPWLGCPICARFHRPLPNQNAENHVFDWPMKAADLTEIGFISTRLCIAALSNLPAALGNTSAEAAGKPVNEFVRGGALPRRSKRRGQYSI